MKKSIFKVSFAAFVFFAQSASVWALQPLVTDDTGTQDTGKQQLEWSFTKERNVQAGERTHAKDQAVVYTFGAAPNLDLYAGGTRLQGDDVRGWSNTVLGAKWRFFETDSHSWALKPEWALPMSATAEAQGQGTGRSSGALTLIYTRSMPFGAIHFNAGVAQDRYKSQTAETSDTRYTRFSMAPVWDVMPDWKLTLDVGQEHARAAAGSVRTRFVQVGAIWAVREDLDWAIGWLNSQDNADDKTKARTLTTGLTWRF
jgi:hypothetical protein